jgi:hypothetical protein
LGRIPVLLTLLPFASLTTLLISFATTARELITLRILAGLGSGGIVTIAGFHRRSVPLCGSGTPDGNDFRSRCGGDGFGF